MANLRSFLYAMLSEDGAIRYANNMRAEIKMLLSTNMFDMFAFVNRFILCIIANIVPIPLMNNWIHSHI